LPHTDRAAVAAIRDGLYAGEQALADHRDQRLPGHRWPVGERQSHEIRGPRQRRVRVPRPADIRGAQAVPLAEDRVESPETLEAAGERDLRDRQRRVDQELLGEQQPVGLGERDRRDADGALHRAPQVPLAHSQLSGQLGDPAPIQRPSRNALGRRRGEPRQGLHLASTGRELRSASETGSKSGMLGRRGRGEESAMVGGGEPRWADRAAVNSSRRDADVEDAVESGIARFERALADIGTGQHHWNLGTVQPGVTPNPDVYFAGFSDQTKIGVSSPMRLSGLVLAAAVALVARPVKAQHIRAWRLAHEGTILREFTTLVSLPNVASDSVNIRHNADTLMAMLQRRGISAQLLELPGSPPAVYGSLPAPGATHTLVLYAHYDGQPVTPSDWSTPPWQPVLRNGAEVVAIPTDGDTVPGETRLYGRSASDDKAPIISMLAALDAVRALGQQPSVNLKFYFEGEEEAGSTHATAMLEKYRDLLKADAWLFCDGPIDQSG